MYEGGRPVYVDNLGDGVKYGFVAITLASNRHDSTLLMEEIETHQHPYSLRMLIKFLVEIAKENRLQLFVSTQSPDVLRYFKIFCPETKVFLIEREAFENEVHVHDEKDLMKIFREVGWDVGDILKYERIVVVDGIEDDIIIENLFGKMKGYSLESVGIRLLLVRGDVRKFGEIVKAVAISSKELIVVKDLDEMKTRDDVLALTISWLRSLENEGWDVKVTEQEIIGEHRTSHKKWKIPKSRILKAGNSQRFSEYKRHSMTDYILEIVLDNPEIASKIGAKKGLSDYKLTAENSKDELQSIFGKYNMELVRLIIDNVSKDMIPGSLGNDIIMVM